MASNDNKMTVHITTDDLRPTFVEVVRSIMDEHTDDHEVIRMILDAHSHEVDTLRERCDAIKAQLAELMLVTVNGLAARLYQIEHLPGVAEALEAAGKDK